MSVGLCVSKCVFPYMCGNAHTNASPRAPKFPQTRQEQAATAHYCLMSCLISAEYKSLIVKRCMFILINYYTEVTE